ncbi:hypothetical protein WMY93_019690 [Mugilogobius chulae]|uniref:Uncharacterized protein n=1 Tax=Mugilogobius chulae TaxID=88201 RepID=A0AAW0NJK4_9GOBI
MADGQGRKRKTVFEVSQKRRKGVEERNKTRVILGESFIRWRALKTQNGLPTDASVAKFLLDSYYSTVTSTPLTHTQWVRPQPPAVSTILEETLSDRDADFSVKGVEKMITSSSSSGGCGEEMVLSQEEPRASTSADVGFIDENDYNSLQNSIIDWDPTWTPDMDTRSVSSSGEDETGESSSEEEEDKESASEEEPRELDSDSDSEDQDYFPPICLRSGAVLPRGISLEDYPVVTLEESVHDEPDDDLNKPETLTPPEAAAVLIEEDVIGKPASIVYHDVIKQLLDFLVLPIDRCSMKDRITKEPCSAAKPFEVSVKSRCTALIVEWVCPNGHTVWKWSSQRYFKFGMLAGDFMLGVNILLSGNNYRKTALLFKFMNMGMIDPKTFHKIQDKFCVDTIEDFWKKESATIVDQLKPKESIVLLGDARMDSPGFCAQYCTYSAMENDTKKIISIVNKDKRETGGNSVAMEKISFVNTMDNICKDLPNIKEFCTDANISISAMFNTGQYKDSGVKHSLDIWHGAKNLSKKIAAAGREKDCGPLLIWNRDISNHFWYCCKEAESYEAFMDLWTGVLHHVTGVHEWYFGACRHASLDEESQTKEWITNGSAAHHRLQQIVLDARWLKNVPKYLSFRSTAELESFHNHILMYASKRFSFSPPVYKARIWLAGLDYNNHLNREARTHADGTYQYGRLYSKRSKMWRLYTIKKQKEYRYIPDLQSAILHSRLLAARGMSEKRPVRLDDPRRLGLLSGAPAPTTEELLQQKASRGLGQPSQP